MKYTLLDFPLGKGIYYTSPDNGVNNCRPSHICLRNVLVTTGIPNVLYCLHFPKAIQSLLIPILFKVSES